MIKRTCRELLILFMLMIAVFWVVYDLNITIGNWNRPKVFLLFGIGIVLIIIFMPHYQSKDWTRLILFAGFFMRIWYTVGTGYMERSHDFGSISLDGCGHGAYINYLFQDGCLPPTNQYQFYHPPFFHVLCAGILKIFSVAHPKDDLITMFQITRAVSCFASCGMLLLILRICEELALSERNKYLVLIGTAFFPGYYIMAGNVNNDALAYLFMMLILYITILWYKDQKMKYVIALGLSFGFGMMTKLNVAVLAFFVGGIMLFAFVKAFREKRAGSLIKEYAIFLLCAFPLGMWYPIRNLIKFHQPFGYVYDIGKSSTLWIKNVSILKRFLPVEWKHFFSPIYLSLPEEYNIYKYIAKCAVFGEYRFECPKAAAILLIICNMLLMVLSVVAIGYLIRTLIQSKSKKQSVGTSRTCLISYSVVILFALWFVSYLFFNVKYPYVCTMDFRYIAMMPVLGYIAIGKLEQDLAERSTTWGKTSAGFLGTIVGMFGILSVYCFCV